MKIFLQQNVHMYVNPSQSSQYTSNDKCKNV